MLTPTRRPTEWSVATVVLVDTLLHGHPAGQRGRSRAEDHHQPVTQVLDLGAAGLGDGLTEDREVTPADLVGRILGQSLGQLGRAHHVREQHGHVLGRHWELSAAARTLLPYATCVGDADRVGPGGRGGGPGG